MTEQKRKGNALRNRLRRLCFIGIGISAFSNPLDKMNLYNILFGAIIGLLFGFLFKLFLKGFLGTLNGSLKKEQGKEVIRSAVDDGMLFLIPFAVMLVNATFLLNWSMTAAFVTAGIMAVGTAAAIEMGKLKGKQEIRNTIASSAVSFVFSFLWTLSFPILVKAPPLLEGGIELIRQMISGGGGLQ